MMMLLENERTENRLIYNVSKKEGVSVSGLRSGFDPKCFENASETTPVVSAFYSFFIWSFLVLQAPADFKDPFWTQAARWRSA
jgi:hypothetical protein